MEGRELIKRGIERIRGFGLKEWGTILIVGICLLILALPSEPAKEKEEEGTKQNDASAVPQEAAYKTEDYVAALERRVEELLAQVEGIGKVQVMITVRSTTERIVLKDGKEEWEQSTEQDSAGGSRVKDGGAREAATVLVDGEGGDVPYITKEVYPEIEGVVVIAQGSGSGTVDLDILAAVQVLFGVPAHKIKIMKMKK